MVHGCYSCVFIVVRQPYKMNKLTQTISRLLPTNCLSVFQHFVGLALKDLTSLRRIWEKSYLKKEPAS